MPDIGFYHPIVIHFAIGLLAAGVLLRWLSLAPRPAFAGPAAALLILLAAGAILVAARSGEDAHDAVEAVPGIAGAVQAHQRWGERTRNIAVAAAALELLGLAIRDRASGRLIRFASAGVGLVAFLAVIETGKLGGELVYGHAGGVGIRSGEAEDVGRLLLAGLALEAELDEKNGRAEDAARLLELAARKFPADAAVQARAAQALLEDRNDPAAALEMLGRIAPPADDQHLRFRLGWLTADALDALGRQGEARAVL